MQKNNKEKGIYAPSYYAEFRCIADACRHSCCIDWEICIDSETYNKYKHMSDIIGTVKVCDDGPCFELTEQGRCPHLNEQGLCNIILSHGEEYLSEICRNHPRFFNYLGNGIAEAGLGIVCEEACRLVLGHEKPFLLEKIEDFEYCDADNSIFDARTGRDRIISVIEAEGSFKEKVKQLINEFNIPTDYTLSEIFFRFLSLEILDTDWKKDLESLELNEIQNYTDNEFCKYYERLLIYFVYRHVSTALSLDNMRARLGFALLSVNIIRALFESSSEMTFENLIDFSRRYSAEIEYSEENTEELVWLFEEKML